MSMEEMWRDISLTTLHQDIPSTPSLTHHHRINISNYRNQQRHEAAKSSRSFRGIILQDFLSGTLKEASSVVPLPDTPHPPTALSLNFGHFFGAHGSVPTRSSSYVPFFAGAHSDGSDGFPPPAAGLAACCAEKRPPEQQPDGDFGDGVDRRKKRMMKNRESAARSRARKQAYTYELELEVAQLVKENRKLKRQCEELRAAMAAQESATTKSKLQRSSSATF